jgi:zinc protease
MMLKRRRPSAVGLALLLSLPFAAPAGAAEVRTITLENGFTVLLAPDSLASAVDVGVWWDGGTRLEREGQVGLTFVMARLLMRTPPQVLERRRRLQVVGANTASIVQPDYVGLSTTVPPDRLEDALEIEAARLESLGFSAAEFATEVAAVREERARRMSSPVGPGLERLFASAFGTHPYGRPVIGRDADLAALTYTNAVDHARRALEPGRAMLTVVGRFDPGPTLDRIRRRFSRLPKATPRAKAAAIRMPPPRARATISADSPVPLLMMGWRGPGESDADAAALEVLAETLGAESDGLHSALGGPHGKVPQLQTSFDRRAQGSLLFVIAAVPDLADSADVERLIEGAVERAAHEPLPDPALDRGRRIAQMGELAPAQTARGRAQALVASRFLTGTDSGERRRVERLGAVTAADVRRAAGAALQPSRRSTVWVLPSNPGSKGSTR